jgi:DNA-binding NarL/FixJ family response regulator
VRSSGGVVRLLICDDHTVVRVGVRAMLAKEPGFEVVGEASDGEEAVAKASRLSPDVVLMDLRMPRRDGVEAIRQIKTENPEAHILVLTEHDTDGDVLRAVEEGAAGYLLKDDPAAYFYQAVRTAAAGESYMTPRATRRLMERHGPGRSEALSPTELEVLALLARGLDKEDICVPIYEGRLCRPTNFDEKR